MKSGSIRLIIIISALYASTVFANVQFHKTLVVHGEQDMIEKAFGGLRELVASWAYMKAEEYHHSGMPFMKAMEFHPGEDSMMSERGPDEHGEEGHHHDHGVAHKEDLYSKIFGYTHVTKDTHLNAAAEKEILPWFYLEVKFDPHDIRGYVLGAYQLERLKKGEEAIAFLREGERHNPDSAQILTAMGQHYFVKGSYEVAFQYLKRACILWQEGKGPNAVNDQYEQTDRFLAYNMLGTIYEERKLYNDAINLYKELYRIDPNKALLNKIQQATLKNPM